jgi:hypothetical protein
LPPHRLLDFLLSHPVQGAGHEHVPDQHCTVRRVEAIIDDLKHTLDTLLGIPARERRHHLAGFQAHCAELESGIRPFPPEVKVKIDSLLWFCERMCHPDFVPANEQSFFLDWPHILLDAIKARLQK